MKLIIGIMIWALSMGIICAQTRQLAGSADAFLVGTEEALGLRIDIVKINIYATTNEKNAIFSIEKSTNSPFSPSDGTDSKKIWQTM